MSHLALLRAMPQQLSEAEVKELWQMLRKQKTPGEMPFHLTLKAGRPLGSPHAPLGAVEPPWLGVKTQGEGPMPQDSWGPGCGTHKTIPVSVMKDTILMTTTQLNFNPPPCLAKLGRLCSDSPLRADGLNFHRASHWMKYTRQL